MICTDLKKPNPYGVNLKINGFSEDDRELINTYMKSYSFEKGMDPALIAAAGISCDNGFACGSYLSPEKEVKVLSYSTHLQQGEDLGQFIIDDVSTDYRAKEITSRLLEFDIAGFQELYAPIDNGRKFAFVLNASYAGHRFFSVPQLTIPEGFTDDGGLLITSRYYIATQDFSLFDKHELSTSAKGV